MDKINLNFFGEEVTIDTPKDLPSLRTQISEKYSLSSSDTAEIILYYVIDSNKIYIINGNDFSKFKESKIPTIFLDVNQNSKLYLDNISQLKKEEKETKEDKKEEEIDIEKEKKEIEQLETEKEEIRKKEKEKMKLYDDKINELVRKIVELEKLKNDLTLERDLDLGELSDKRNAIINIIKEKKKKIEPKKEEEIKLKAEPKPEPVKKSGGYQIRSGQNNFPYPKDALKRNFEKEKKYKEQLKAAKEKRLKERKALEEKKLLENKNEEYINEILKIENPEAIPIFMKVNDVLKKTIEQVKVLAKEKVMTNDEKELAKKEEDIKKEKEKYKKEQIDKIKKITKDAVKEINDLTKLVIEQSNSLIERVNNPELYRSSSSDNILLRTAPKMEKKEKPEVHYHIICDGCKTTPIRGIRYKCKQCKDFDFCQDCYDKNKESHGHDFRKILHPPCRNRPGHPNKEYCNRGVIHSKVMCDGCGMLPISGWRFKCSICDDYNLCENCEERLGREHDHPLIKLRYSLMLKQFNDNYLKINSYEPKK